MWRPGRNFRVGAMRERVTVQSYVNSRDDSGQRVSTWSDILTDEPAQFFPTGGGASYRGQRQAEQISAVFVIRYRDIINSTHRLVYDGRTYGIKEARRVDGGRRYLELICESIEA